MARPKKDSGELRSETIALRLTSAERMRVEEAARRAEMTPTEYARMQTLQGRVVMNQHRTLDPAVFEGLNRIGVNLNQLTRLAHIEGKLPPELPRLCQDIERFLAKELDGYDREDH